MRPRVASRRQDREAAVRLHTGASKPYGKSVGNAPETEGACRTKDENCLVAPEWLLPTYPTVFVFVH